MSQRMNRQYRREMERAEKRRHKRVGAMRSRRERRVTQGRETAKAGLKNWFLTAYKPADMLLLFLVLWAFRYAAMFWLGSQGGDTVNPVHVVIAGIVTQGLFALVLVSYIRYLAREEVEWLGPPEEQTAPTAAVITGLLLGVLAWGLTYLLGLGWTWLGRMVPLPEGPGATPLWIPGNVPPAVAFDSPTIGIGVAVAALVVANALADELFYRRVLMRLLERIGLREQARIFFSIFLFAVSMGTTDYMLGSVLAGAAFALAYHRSKATIIPVLGNLAWGALRFIIG